MSHFLGFDPDMHTTAYAVVDDTYKPVMVGVLRATGKQEQAAVVSMLRQLYICQPLVLKLSALAVESQEIYTGTPDPRNILHLGHVAGAILYHCIGWYPDAMPYFPTPSQWKGQQDKGVHHRRILHKGGIDPAVVNTAGGKEPYCWLPGSVPIVGADQLKQGDWKHVVDAMGLAQWAAHEFLFQEQKVRCLNLNKTPPDTFS